MFTVVLHQPQIPPNTGNIIRLCANTGCDLHLIEPLGFSLEEKQLRRAGLDYHQYVMVKSWVDWPEFIRNRPGRILSFSTQNSKPYTAFSYEPGDVLLFGSETKGLPAQIHREIESEHKLTIPMQSGSRSLNLSNSVAIAVYEAWRQQDFVGASRAI